MLIKQINQIPEYSEVNERYYITSEGNVLSRHKSVEKTLKNVIDKSGYYFVNLRGKKKNKIGKIHRLIALAFIENPENKPFVNHIDGDKTNNSINNLEWVTNAENTNHAVRTGLHNHGKAVLQLDMNNKILNRFASAQEAAIKTNIERRNISSCCRGRKKTAGGYKWCYENPENTKTNASKPRPVMQLSKTGQIMEIYNSISSASRAIGCSLTRIREACGDKFITYKGYIWKYLEN